MSGNPIRRAWYIWGAAVLCYIVAIFSRTSLSATGINAAERFHIDSATLSGFAVLQLVVYAGMQVPVGVLIDRFGARSLIVTGASIMTVGQILLALTDDTGAAIGARALVGAGDAMTFISVLRLIPAWFPNRHIPMLTQVTGMLGQLGQIASVVPLVIVLDRFGWTTAYLGIAAITAFGTLLGLVVIRNAPVEVEGPTGSISLRSALGGLPESWRHPATRLGFWSHFVTPFAGSSFTMLWGFPFLIAGEGFSRDTASALYIFLVVISLGCSVATARLVVRHPLRRSWIVLGIVAAQASVWTCLLFWPGSAPLALVGVLMVTFAVGGPGSLIGFDFAQQFTPAHRLGSATGLINTAGFIAAIAALFFFGVALDLHGAGTPSDYTREAFRTAMLVYYPIWSIGTVGVWRSRAALRRWIADNPASALPVS
ncbi:MFS transporter [Klugiella xanthotipulae]